MEDQGKNPTTKHIAAPVPLDPTMHLYQFLNDNDYELSVDAISSKNPFIPNQGFVLTDKPLLLVKVAKKGPNAL